LSVIRLSRMGHAGAMASSVVDAAAGGWQTGQVLI
jgi:hypothetical protein